MISLHTQHLSRKAVYTRRIPCYSLRPSLREFEFSVSILFLFLFCLSIGGAEKMGQNEQIMQNIITRRKLVDLAKTQASQIGVLRAEVERLRMRTFPALVQLDS